MTYAPAKLEIATSNDKGGDAFTRNRLFDIDLAIKIIQNAAQYLLHHVTYAPAQFKVVTSNGLGGDAFTRKCPGTLYIM